LNKTEIEALFDKVEGLLILDPVCQDDVNRANFALILLFAIPYDSKMFIQNRNKMMSQVLPDEAYYGDARLSVCMRAIVRHHLPCRILRRENFLLAMFREIAFKHEFEPPLELEQLWDEIVAKLGISIVDFLANQLPESISLPSLETAARSLNRYLQWEKPCAVQDYTTDWLPQIWARLLKALHRQDEQKYPWKEASLAKWMATSKARFHGDEFRLAAFVELSFPGPKAHEALFEFMLMTHINVAKRFTCWNPESE
jgi:hypothetical protein